MKLEVPKGRYVAAVSGGVDSMALLNMLSNLPGVEPVVAHFNHGMRQDSGEDEQLIAITAKKHGLPFEAGRAELGEKASEAAARAARYDFLRQVQKKYGAKAIITAHQQDDLIETALINLLRGTGRRGLTAMAQNPEILRPLLNFSKQDLVEYAKKHGLKWREDPSNSDAKYLRNYIRQNVTPNLLTQQKKQLLSDIKKLNRLNPLLDQQIATLSQSLLLNNQINRQKFINLPPEIAVEVLAYFLRRQNIRQFDKKSLERLTMAIKTAKPGTKHNVFGGVFLEISRTSAHLAKGVN